MAVYRIRIWSLSNEEVTVLSPAVLKAALYRRLCCAVGVYPLLLFVALMVFLFNHDWRWMWLRCACLGWSGFIWFG